MQKQKIYTQLKIEYHIQGHTSIFAEQCNIKLEYYLLFVFWMY